MRDYKAEQSRLHLFATPSFMTGIARLVDAFRVLNTYNTEKNEVLADNNALLSDWLAVGDAISYGIEEYVTTAEAQHS